MAILKKALKVYEINQTTFFYFSKTFDTSVSFKWHENIRKQHMLQINQRKIDSIQEVKFWIEEVIFWHETQTYAETGHMRPHVRWRRNRSISLNSRDKC